MRFSLLILFLGISVVQVLAQTQEAAKPEPKKEITELRLKLNEDGSHYIKGTFLNQTWLRFNESNPGTTVLGEPAKQTFDIGLRRTRLSAYGQVSDHVLFYFQVGQNNFNFQSQNAGNRKVQLFVHDALGEYKVNKKSDVLYLGAGLTITNGLSRFTQPSISSIMSMDVPVFLQATVDQIDEFARKLSVYARGQIGKLDYRVILTDPFPVNTNGSLGTTASGGIVIPAVPASGVVVNTPNSAFAQLGHHKQYQGFFMWNFFEKESHATPYATGTYLGTKKVFNLEAGFIAQKNALWTSNETLTGMDYHNLNLWSVALFYDAPVNKEKGTALNAYAGYFNTYYGPGYLRYNGQMNPATGGTVNTNAQSWGNGWPMFGTGRVIYTQAGYLLRRDLFGEGNGTLMPYFTLQSSHYDRLDKQMTVFDVGLNWFIRGHSSKITLDYQNRPVYDQVAGSNNLALSSSRRSQVVMQYQIAF